MVFERLRDWKAFGQRQVWQRLLGPREKEQIRGRAQSDLQTSSSKGRL